MQRKKIDHPVLGTVRAYAEVENGTVFVLDVEKGGETLPRERWMSDFHDDLAKQFN